jgi:hypothetical protein
MHAARAFVAHINVLKEISRRGLRKVRSDLVARYRNGVL